GPRQVLAIASATPVPARPRGGRRARAKRRQAAPQPEGRAAGSGDRQRVPELGMSAHTDESGALSHIVVEPEGHDETKGYPLVVLLHGFGANMHDLVSLAPAIAGRGYIYAFPNAPFAVDFGGGAVGYRLT